MDLDDEELEETKKIFRKNKIGGKMEYNFLKKEVYMPEKHFIKDRVVKLGKHENIFFAVLWFSRDNRATYKELYKRIYKSDDINLALLRQMRYVLKSKGIKIKAISKYGYVLVEE